MGNAQVATLGIRLWPRGMRVIATFCEMERYWNSAVVNGSLTNIL